MLLQTNFMYHNQFLPGIVETGNFSGCTPHTTITDLATAVTPIVLPVTFGSITAVLNGKTLKVSFTTLTETNNDYYNIEVSNDGKLFKTATRLQSQAINGNSTVPLHYNISLDYNTINYLGWPLFFLVPLIGVIGIVRKRKPLLLISGLTGILFIFLVGCQKSGDETVNQNSADKIFVRIAQVDKDGTTVYSKIVKAVEGE